MVKNTISSRNTAIILSKTLVFSAYSGNCSCFSSNSLIMRRLRLFFCHFRAIFFLFRRVLQVCSEFYRKIGLRLLEGVFLLFSSFLSSSFLSSLIPFTLYSLFVCVSPWLSVYDEEGREEYLWEIRQRGGGAAPSRPCCGAAPINLAILFVLANSLLQTLG